MNLPEVICPYCREKTFFARFCEKCGEQIAHDCPLCDSLHLKGTTYCRNSGNSLESYKKLLEMIIDLLDNFGSSEEYKEFSKWEFSSVSTAFFSFLLCLGFGIAGVVTHGQGPTYIIAVISGGVFLLSFACVVDLRKTYRHALKKIFNSKRITRKRSF